MSKRGVTVFLPGKVLKIPFSNVSTTIVTVTSLRVNHTNSRSHSQKSRY